MLRPIPLLDIEANMHNKALWRYAINQAEELEVIGPEQYVSGKHKTSKVQALNTRLLYDRVRQNKVTSTTVLDYLISKYYLMVNRIASLVLQIVNTPKEAIHCKYSTLHYMVPLVRTAFGYSDNTHAGDIWEIPLKLPPPRFSPSKCDSLSNIVHCYIPPSKMYQRIRTRRGL